MNDLPRSLTRYETEFELAIRRELASRRQLRRPAFRLSLVVAAAAAVALGLLSALPGNGPNVVARAAAAITGSTDSILHVSAITRDTGVGGVYSSQTESWQETSAPFATRSLHVGAGGARLETLQVNGSTQVYDAATNTIYTNSSGAYNGGGNTPQSPPPNKAGAAKGGSVGTGPAKPVTPTQSRDPYRGKILSILHSGAVTVAGHTTVDGRDALILAGKDGQTTIYVDPQTYQPIQFRTSTGAGTVTTTFQTYEELPRNPANDALVSLTAQHPSASIDNSAADYLAAVARLGGKA
jgi:outer membrane lipoprotein-sorting protein